MNAPLVYAIYAGATFLLVLLLVIGLRLIARRQKRLGQRVFRLQITNQGNMNCHYALMAQEPAGVLRFALLQNGVALPPYAPPPPVQPTVQPVAQAAPAQPARGAPRRGAAASAGRKGAKKKKGSQVGKTSGKVAGILMSLGSLLPGRSGQGISRAGSQVRQVQIKTDQANRLSSNVGDLASSGEQPPSEAPPPPRSRKDAPPPAAPHPAAQPQAAPAAPAAPGWVQTPYITPGEALLIDLVVTPTRPRQAQMYSFKVLSRCIEKSETPVPLSQEAEEIEFGALQARGISWLGVYWPHLLWTAIVIGLAALSFYYLSSLVPLTALG